MTDTADPHGLARRVADAMWARDWASQHMGMVIEHVGPGTATLSMTVQRWMLNGHGSCHGGMIFSLADSAFAFACNSYDAATVAAVCDIAFIAPGREGDRLTAHADERTRWGRSGLYDITVTNQDGAIIAEFRGHSRTVRGSVIDAMADAGSEKGGDAS